MRLLTACLWAVLSLFSNQSSGQAELACSEMFKLADPRNCCSIPFLLSPDVLEPCLQIQLIPNSLEGENCRAECILNHTNIITDGHFQLQNAQTQLTKAISGDNLLAAYIHYASVQCYRMYAAGIDEMKQAKTCTLTARHILDCIFAITYRKCPKHYWTDTDKCKLLVRTLNECPYFLVYSDRY